ncbi:MAG: DNA gyrase inhibitor YacG [Pseudomonadota bacterium]
MNANASPVTPAQCPICRAKTVQKWRPFCSKRCADVDLGRWMTGSYAIPAEEADERDIPRDD